MYAIDCDDEFMFGFFHRIAISVEDIVSNYIRTSPLDGQRNNTTDTFTSDSITFTGFKVCVY